MCYDFEQRNQIYRSLGATHDHNDFKNENTMRFSSTLTPNEFYLWQLLSYPDLSVRVVIDLEPGWFYPATSVPPWDDSLSSAPVKVDLGINI